MEAKNTGNKPFELTAALHTYIAVSAVDKVRCTGPKCMFLLLKCLPRQSVFKQKARVKPICWLSGTQLSRSSVPSF